MTIANRGHVPSQGTCIFHILYIYHLIPPNPTLQSLFHNRSSDLNLAPPLPLPSYFALVVHSASPPDRLDSFSSLDAVYLVASLAGTRTLIAGLTFQRPPPSSTAVEVYSVYPAYFTARIYSYSRTLLPSHDPFYALSESSPP